MFKIHPAVSHRNIPVSAESTAILPLPSHPEVLLPHFQNLLQQVLSTHPPDLWFSLYSYWEDPELFCEYKASLALVSPSQSVFSNTVLIMIHTPSSSTCHETKGKTHMPLFQPLDKIQPQLSASSCFVNSYSCLTKVLPSCSTSIQHSQSDLPNDSLAAPLFPFILAIPLT